MPDTYYDIVCQKKGLNNTYSVKNKMRPKLNTFMASFIGGGADWFYLGRGNAGY